MATHVETRPGGGRQHPVRLGPVAFSGFPVRSLTRQIRGASDGGEWITAYQLEQSRRLRAVVSTSVRDTESARARRALRPPTNTREVSGMVPKKLGSFFLLEHCYVEEPTDLCVCNISGMGLRDYKTEELALFDNVVYINAAENQLPLEAFRTFPMLQELELSLNGMVDVSIQSGDFTQLQCLDLSYNTVSGLALLSLGTLPALKELHLTGNNIVALPVEMSRPVSTAGTDRSSQKARLRFPALERLWLDDNKLTDQATFATLAGLRKLKYLNLDHNEIFVIPLLKLIGTRPLKSSGRTNRSNLVQAVPDDWDIRFDETPPPSPLAAVRPRSEAGSFPGSRPHTRGKFSGRNTRECSQDDSAVPVTTQSEAGQSSVPFPDADTTSRYGHETTPQRSPLATPPHQLRRSSLGTDSREEAPAPVQTRQGEEPPLSAGGVAAPPSLLLTHSMAPFPELHTLSLANNLILTAEGVLACGSWPALKQLLIYGNPLTGTSKGMPLLLQSHLVEQCGISVVRHKRSSGKQYRIGKAAKDFKKVSTAPPPTIPKQPLLPALEAPPPPATLMLEYPSPSSSPSSRSSSPSLHSHASSSHRSSIGRAEGGRGRGGESVWTKPEGEESGEEQQGVFLTQPAGGESLPPAQRQPSPRDGSDRPWSVREEFRAKRKAAQEKYKDLPEQYRGYEMLMDTYDDPSVSIPADIHSCTRALQYALKHPLVLADSSSKPSSSSSQPHPHRRPRKFLTRKPSAVSLKPDASSKISEMQRVLDDIRSRCVALEANVGEVLHPKTPTASKSLSQLQKESRQLLAELQLRYDHVRASSMKTLRPLSEHTSPTRTGTYRSPLTPPSRGPSSGRERTSTGTSPCHSSDTHSENT